MREMFDIDPVAIAMEMRDAVGQIYTCYWMASQDDRALMIDAMRNDSLFDWLRNNKYEILEILNEEDDEYEGTDTETDSEG